MNLNSFSVIELLINLYWGISLYKAKYSFHSLCEEGGSMPLNNSQFVMDNPESVILVNPPTITMNRIRIIDVNNQFSNNLL